MNRHLNIIRHKKFLLLIFAIWLVSPAADAQDKPKDWAQFGRYAEMNETAPKGAKAVFMGNSITDVWAKRRPEFFSENGYIGRGISGQTTSQILVRFRRDVIDLQPLSVVILAGTNDIALNGGYISLENIAGNIASMAELAKVHGIKVIICSVLPAYDYKWRPGLEPADKILELNGLLRRYAEMNGCVYVDYHSVMKDERNGLPEKYSTDGVHPTDAGYEIMESIIKPAIENTLSGK